MVGEHLPQPALRGELFVDLLDFSLQRDGHFLGGSDPLRYLGSTSAISPSEKPLACRSLRIKPSASQQLWAQHRASMPKP